MTDKADVLLRVMRETHTSQSTLSRLSGVHQPSISEFLSGRIGMSDEMLQRLLSCMQFQLQVVRTPLKVEMDRQTQRRWLLHRQLLGHFSPDVWPFWQQQMRHNIHALQGSTHGQPHERNLDRWQQIVDASDIGELRRVMLDTSTDGIEMREVSPMSGLLPDAERLQVLQLVRT